MVCMYVWYFSHLSLCKVAPSHGDRWYLNDIPKPITFLSLLMVWWCLHFETTAMWKVYQTPDWRTWHVKIQNPQKKQPRRWICPTKNSFTPEFYGTLTHFLMSKLRVRHTPAWLDRCCCFGGEISQQEFVDGVLQMVVRDVPAETMRDFSAMGGEHFPMLEVEFKQQNLEYTLW